MDMDKYVLYCKSVQGSTIRTLFEILKEILHDTALKFDETGIRLLCLDGARVALVYMKLLASAFEEFHCQTTVFAGINMNSMFKLLKITGSHDCITLYMEHGNTGELGVKIHNAEKNSVTDFKLKLMDVDSEEIKIPDVEFDSIITMPSVYLQRLTRDMLNIAQDMTITSEGSKLTLSCSGDFARQETVIGEADAGMNISAKTSKKISMTFSLKYLSLFTKASGLCSTIELFLREQFPLILKYHVSSLGEIRFCLAAKFDETAQ